jgi:aminoglycoside phosphotransferase (APT) family kinase protein
MSMAYDPLADVKRPTALDTATIGQVLLPWLRERLSDGQELSNLHVGIAQGGASSETFFLRGTVNGAEGARQQRWVLRGQPTRTPIYLDASVERQYRVFEALARHSDVPVPEPIGYEGDPGVIGAPFFVMSHVDGALPGALHHSDGLYTELGAAEREAVWLAGVEAMSRVHRVDPSAVEFLDRPELGTTGLAQEIAYWDRYREWSGVPGDPVQERTRRWLEDNAPDLDVTGLAWGDARPANMLFAGGRCTAVIDWETVSLGGPETDLGWWIFYDWFVAEGSGVPRLEGVGAGPALIAAWEHFSGRKAQALEWHEVFATWRFGLIRDRALKLAGMTPMQAMGIGGRDPLLDRLSELTGS